MLPVGPLSTDLLMMKQGAGNHDVPPPGCEADAMKLFVGGIPKCYTEGQVGAAQVVLAARRRPIFHRDQPPSLSLPQPYTLTPPMHSQLLPFFSTVGKVVDLIVVRNSATHQSKGSAFLWYEKRTAAEQAISHFHMRHSLPDPTGMCHRPLVVTRARDFTPQNKNAQAHARYVSAPLPQPVSPPVSRREQRGGGTWAWVGSEGVGSSDCFATLPPSLRTLTRRRRLHTCAQIRPAGFATTSDWGNAAISAQVAQMYQQAAVAGSVRAQHQVSGAVSSAW
jgi:hypothetical protein